MNEQRLPMVTWMRDDIYRVSFIDNSRSLEFMFSGADVGNLIASAGKAFNRKYLSEDLKEHHRRCAI
jgi:hypothetical protein